MFLAPSAAVQPPRHFCDRVLLQVGVPHRHRRGHLHLETALCLCAVATVGVVGLQPLVRGANMGVNCAAHHSTAVLGGQPALDCDRSRSGSLAVFSGDVGADRGVHEQWLVRDAAWVRKHKQMSWKAAATEAAPWAEVPPPPHIAPEAPPTATGQRPGAAPAGKGLFPKNLVQSPAARGLSLIAAMANSMRLVAKRLGPKSADLLEGPRQRIDKIWVLLGERGAAGKLSDFESELVSYFRPGSLRVGTQWVPTVLAYEDVHKFLRDHWLVLNGNAGKVGRGLDLFFPIVGQSMLGDDDRALLTPLLGDLSAFDGFYVEIDEPGYSGSWHSLGTGAVINRASARRTTPWPSTATFPQLNYDKRLQAIRLNEVIHAFLEQRYQLAAGAQDFDFLSAVQVKNSGLYRLLETANSDTPERKHEDKDLAAAMVHEFVSDAGSMRADPAYLLGIAAYGIEFMHAGNYDAAPRYAYSAEFLMDEIRVVYANNDLSFTDKLADMAERDLSVEESASELLSILSDNDVRNIVEAYRTQSIEFIDEMRRVRGPQRAELQDGSAPGMATR